MIARQYNAPAEVDVSSMLEDDCAALADIIDSIEKYIVDLHKRQHYTGNQPYAITINLFILSIVIAALIAAYVLNTIYKFIPDSIGTFAMWGGMIACCIPFSCLRTTLNSSTFEISISCNEPKWRGILIRINNDVINALNNLDKIESTQKQIGTLLPINKKKLNQLIAQTSHLTSNQSISSAIDIFIKLNEMLYDLCSKMRATRRPISLFFERSGTDIEKGNRWTEVDESQPLLSRPGQ